MEKSDEETPPKQAAIPCTMVLNKLPQNSKPTEEVCGCGSQCPICTQSTQNLKEDSEEEDWNGNRQRTKKEDQLKGTHYPQSPQYAPPYDFPDRLSHHSKMEKYRTERLEFLNDKYNLDYYSDSDSDSEHEYETLV